MFSCDFFRKSVVGAVVSAALSLVQLVHAGGGGITGGATEWTQIANNGQLAKVSADSALTAKTTIDQYMTQLQQLQIQMQNIAKLGQPPEGLQDIIRAQQSLSNYRTALERLYGSLEQQKDLMDKRFTEARLSGMTWDQYRERQVELARQQNQRAIQRMEMEARVLDQVEEDYKYSQRMAAQAPMTEGVHQATQMLNHQMSRLVAQNSRVTRVLVEAQMAESNKMSEEAAAKHRSAEELRYLNQRDAAIRERQRRFVEGSK